MTQRGWWDVAELMHIKEGTFGTKPTSGTWLPVALCKRFVPEYRPTRRPKVGLNRQNPSDWSTVKKLWGFNIELEALKNEASPAYTGYTMDQYIIEAVSGADGAPDFTLDSFSLGAKVDLDTDEFWTLSGCKMEQVDIIGRAVDDLVTKRYSGIAQNGDYNVTDYVSGTASRQAQPTPATQIKFSECDVLVGTTPTSIMDDVSEFRLGLRRTLQPRGTDLTTGALYRAFREVGRTWEVEIVRDFDDRTDYENFIDDTKVKCTIEVESAEGGKIYALTSGYWMPGSGLPVEELDLLSVRLQGEFAELAVSTHGA